MAVGGEASEGGEERRVASPDPVERGPRRGFGSVDSLGRAGGGWAGFEEVERVTEQQEVGIRGAEVVDETGARVVVERGVVGAQMEVTDDDDGGQERSGR